MTTGPKLVLSAYVAQPDACFLEWLAYHRAIGATDVVVFTDRRQSGKQPLFDALAAAGVLRIVPVAVDPDMKEEIHNSALRAGRLEAEESGGYGLYLAADEYFCIMSSAKSVQSLMRASGGADVLSTPVRVAGVTEAEEPGSVLFDARMAAPVTSDAPLRSVVRLGLFGARNPEVPTGPAQGKQALKWRNGDSAPMPEPHSRLTWIGDAATRGTAKATILKIPAPSAATYHLRQEALPTKQRPDAEALRDRLESYRAIKGEGPDLSPHLAETARVLGTLMALPGLAEAQEALCAEERALGDRLHEATASDAPVEAAPPAPRPEAKEDGIEPDDDMRPEASAALPPWFAEIHTGGENEGFYTRLQNHALVCIRRDPSRLVVSFDNLSNVNDLSPEREPWAYKFVRDNGWSHMAVMARRKDWYRCPQLIAHLEKLAADGVFAEFEKVILTGTSMGGFAALAFASLAPGATVVSFNPQTTLDETLVPWEKRFGMGRARDWSLAHSDCAFEIDEVEKAFVLYDPFFEPDRRHVDRLEGDNVIRLKTWCSGHFSPVFLRRAGLLKPLMQHALDDTLTPQVFYKMYRDRRFLPWYRKALQTNLQERGHDKLARIVSPAFRKLKRQAAE
ncbi:pimeloyl-ACP methyl ester carboxylesterase [Roseovarius sp. MBR-154]